MPSYYDIDAILAEEELITVRPAFAFAHLAHLDPDSCRPVAVSVSRKRRREGDKTSSADLGPGHALPEGTKIRMPLWAIDRWAMLGFVKIPALPRHYRQRTMERLEADPVAMNLSAKNEHYFIAGTLLTDLLLRAARVARRHSSSRGASSARALAAERQAAEACTLRTSLLAAMMGERLRRNFDRTLAAPDADGDDADEWTRRLSVLESRMFEVGAEASGAARRWRELGSGRLSASIAATRGRSAGRMGLGVATSGTTPVGGSGGEKRRIVTPVGGEADKSF